MNEKQKTLKIAFVHPDLGIGGAERLVVDAALGLQNLGHSITVYTSHHDITHCFEETKNELKVKEYGDFLPQSLFGYFHILFSILRGLYLSLYILFNKRNEYDIIFADQLATYVPILKMTRAKILFYCHFPDKNLATRNSSIKNIYRIPFDLLEEYSIRLSDVILVNSSFTRSIFKESFPKLKNVNPEVLYPGINMKAYDKEIDNNDSSLDLIKSNKKIILSINRFERKKNLELTIKTLKELKSKYNDQQFNDIRLVIAGGYDVINNENVQYHKELEEIAKEYSFSYTTIWPESLKDRNSENIKNEIEHVNIVFLLSFNDVQRTWLLKNSKCLLYTPSNEHFGIVPVEAMYSGLPVVAVKSGGPKESVIHGKTGFLCPSDEVEFSKAVYSILNSENDNNTTTTSPQENQNYQINITEVKDFSKNYVMEKFGMDTFSNTLNSIILKMNSKDKMTTSENNNNKKDKEL